MTDRSIVTSRTEPPKEALSWPSVCYAAAVWAPSAMRPTATPSWRRGRSSSSPAPHDHRFSVPFSDEAEIPRTWDCKVCGEPALLVHGELPEPKKVKPARTHWDMLLERRTLPDLEEVLAERLQVLHDRQGLKSA